MHFFNNSLFFTLFILKYLAYTSGASNNISFIVKLPAGLVWPGMEILRFL